MGAVPSTRPAGRVSALVALGVSVTVVAAACGSSGFQYVSSSDQRAFFKIPANWKFFDKRNLLVASGQSLSGETNRQFPWLIGYDSSPSPEVTNVIDTAEATPYPTVMARVEELPSQTRDNFSISSLRNWVYPVDRLAQVNAAEILSYEDVVLDGGLHGIEMTFDVVLGGVSNVTAGNKVIRVTQSSVVDPATETLYLFMIRCESHCYRDNKSLIDVIVKSWTVKER